MGTLIVRSADDWLGLVLKTLPSANFKLFAVVAVNEPPILSVALPPSIMPLGLSRNRFALPLARIKPSMFEIDEPVTRLIIF